MRHKIQNELKPYNYSMQTCTKSKFVDDDSHEEFIVYTVELKEEIEDYSALLKVEKAIVAKLRMIEDNTILVLL